ncbi:MAG: ATP synthase F0 subunit C [Bdellovibrionaceae bacterium]|nr:ATP synthase F0 subunit C [Pseudobdellovibrionaceae bacterium]NUM59566.1 ATP synthase F0 subunit C [Pseudobdellovibrionaceae bacterium]
MKKYTIALATLLASASVFAEEAATHTAAAATATGSDKGMLAIAAALCMGVAVLGGTFSQGKAASAALDGIARNPAAQDKIFTPMLLSLALIESLVILGFLVAFVKIGGLL